MKITYHPQHATKKCNCICLIHNNSSSADSETTDSPSPSEEPSGLTKQNKITSAKEGIYSARDNIIEAYKLTFDRTTQTKFLDLLNILRSFTESKNNIFQTQRGFPIHQHIGNRVAHSQAPTHQQQTKQIIDQEVMRKLWEMPLLLKFHPWWLRHNNHPYQPHAPKAQLNQKKRSSL